MNKTTHTPLTNQALYQLLRDRPEPPTSLRLYLTGLANRLSAHSGQGGLSASDFVTVLFGKTVMVEVQGDVNPDFAQLLKQLETQIEDLSWFEDQGTLSSPDRYFGLDVPAGRRWYNFEVADYLEAAVVGTFGGWQPGDGGRQLVVGNVAVLDAQGNLTSVPASEMHDPIETIEFVDWSTLAEFIDDGRSYE